MWAYQGLIKALPSARAVVVQQLDTTQPTMSSQDLDIFPGRSDIKKQLTKAFKKYDFKQSELEKGQNSLKLMKLDSYNEKFDHEVITDLSPESFERHIDLLKEQVPLDSRHAETLKELAKSESKKGSNSRNVHVIDVSQDFKSAFGYCIAGWVNGSLAIAFAMKTITFKSKKLEEDGVSLVELKPFIDIFIEFEALNQFYRNGIIDFSPKAQDDESIRFKSMKMLNKK